MMPRVIFVFFSERGGEGCAARLLIFSFFPCSADPERDWPLCKVPGSFFGLATKTLNVRNNNNNYLVQFSCTAMEHSRT